MSECAFYSKWFKCMISAVMAEYCLDNIDSLKKSLKSPTNTAENILILSSFWVCYKNGCCADYFRIDSRRIFVTNIINN